LIYKLTIIGKELKEIIQGRKLSYRKVAEDLGIDHWTASGA